MTLLYRKQMSSWMTSVQTAEEQQQQLATIVQSFLGKWYHTARTPTVGTRTVAAQYNIHSHLAGSFSETKCHHLIYQSKRQECFQHVIETKTLEMTSAKLISKEICSSILKSKLKICLVFTELFVLFLGRHSLMAGLITL